MAYVFDRTGTHKYLRGDAPAWYASDLFTVACWFNVGDVTNAHTLLRLEHGGDNRRFLLQARGDVSGDRVRFISQVGAATYEVDSGGGFSANTWHHVIAIANRIGGQLHISLDGSVFATVASVKFPVTDPGFFQVSGDSTLIPAAIGSIAEVGLWGWGVWDTGIAMNPGSASLAAGFSPWVAQPKELIGYWPLVRGLQDVTGGNTLTAYNSPGIGEHCRVMG